MYQQLSRNIWIFTILIMASGLLALYSASFQNVRVTNDVFYDQLHCALAGLVLIWILGKIDYRKFFDAAYIFYGINLLLLVGVLFLGRHALGAQRWIELGPLSFQPSELTKLSIILMLGRYFSQRRPLLSFSLESQMGRFFYDLILPFFLTLLPVFLIFKQPDLGTAILVLGIFFIMAFVSGVEYKYFLGVLIVFLCFVPFGWHFLRQYQKDRLLVFLNPNIDPLGSGYNIIQSKIAVGSGGFWGKGWLSGTQNQLNFIPERHTDFIFAVIGEEGGFWATIFVLFCFFMVINAGLDIASQVKDKFGVMVTVGIVGILTFQVVINVGMALGLCPVVGITLPFVSYGRTSFMVSVIMIGFLVSLSKRRTMF